MNCVTNFYARFHTSTILGHIIKLTRMRVVDNSEIGKLAMAEGKPPRCIHIYNKKGVGTIGKHAHIYSSLFMLWEYVFCLLLRQFPINVKPVALRISRY